MELVEGETLAERMAGPLAARRRARLSPARSPKRSKPRTRSGIIHRDLKPANVKSRRRAKSRSSTSAWPRRSGDGVRPRRSLALADAHRGHDRAGVILGTAAYMSPEQARGKRRGPAHRHLVVRLRALRDAHRRPAFAGETVSDTLARDPQPRARLERAARGHAGARRELLLRLPAEGPREACPSRGRRPASRWKRR